MGPPVHPSLPVRTSGGDGQLILGVGSVLSFRVQWILGQGRAGSC